MNEDHVEIVKEGVDAVAKWRDANPGVVLDLKSADLAGCDLSGIDLSGAELSQANLSESRLAKTNFDSADLTYADLSKSIAHNASMKNANLDYSTLKQANLSYVDFQNASAKFANFNSSLMLAANFEGANLHHSFMKECKLSGTNFSGAILDDAFLPEAYLLRTNFKKANLTDANFSNAKMSESKLEDAILKGVDFTSADFRDVKTDVWFDDNQIDKLKCRSNAKHPWFILRRSYTGPKLLFLLLFSVIAFSPIFGKAVFYSWLGDMEKQSIPLAVSAIKELDQQLDRIPKDQLGSAQAWLDKSSKFLGELEKKKESKHKTKISMAKSIVDLLETAPSATALVGHDIGQLVDDCNKADRDIERARLLYGAIRPTDKLESWSVWQLLLGLQHGWFSCAFVVLVLIYNCFRAILTYWVAPLRFEEENTRTTPRKSDYLWLYRLHLITCLLFWFAVGSTGLMLFDILFTTVLLPA